jgi:hypothetical protein
MAVAVPLYGSKTWTPRKRDWNRTQAAEMKYLSSMHSNLPHILCLTEHHIKQLELEHIHIENYN